MGHFILIIIVMVDINRNKISRRRVGQGKPLLSSFINVGRCRNFILFVVVIQSLRMLSGFFFITDNESESSNHSHPNGLIEQLEDSISHRSIRSSSSESDRAKQQKKQEQEQKPPENHIDARADGKTSSRHQDADEKKKDVTIKNEGVVGEKAADLNPIVLDKKGTGPTKVGYVKDFIDERKNPVYRNTEITITDSSSAVAKLVHEKSVQPCQNSSMLKNPRCSDPDTPLIAYNPESFTRTWCGQEIKSQSAVVMTDHCTDPIVHLFPVEIPPISGEHMPPIIIKSKLDKELKKGDLDDVQCNIPCQREKGLVFGNGDRFIDGEPWSIVQKFGRVAIERTAFMKDRYYSTQSLISSVPLTNYDVKIHSLRNQPPVDFDTVKEKAIYLVDKDCAGGSTKRHRWYDAVKSKTQVDSYGSCGHNIEVPKGMTITTPEDRIALMKQYRIVLAFDDSKEKDHVSSMIWEAFVSGAVPVVVGADNIRDRLPPHSFINANDHNSWDGLAQQVEKIVSNKELWESYHKWRNDDKHAIDLDNMYEFAQTGPTCRLCRWAYAKKYGLGWDHTKQEVRSIPKIPKEKFCTTADHDLVSKPFVEQWVTKFKEAEKVHKEDSEGESCSFLISDSEIELDSFKGHRQVSHHDGVTDFFITDLKNENIDNEVILRLNFPGVRNPEGACFYNTHTLIPTTRGAKVSSASIQDNLVKVTIVANWETSVRSIDEGIIEIVIQKGNDNSIEDDSPPKRLRIIIEDTSPIHDKMTEYLPSSFSKLMVKDFIDPLEVFFADS